MPAHKAEPSTGRRYATPREAAEYLHCTPRTIQQMAADGRITAYRNGSRIVRYDLNEIDARMEPSHGGAL